MTFRAIFVSRDFGITRRVGTWRRRRVKRSFEPGDDSALPIAEGDLPKSRVFVFRAKRPCGSTNTKHFHAASKGAVMRLHSPLRCRIIAKPLPLLLSPASTPSCKTPAAAAPPKSADAAHLYLPNPSACATRRAPECFFVSAAERSAAAGILQEVKSQETGGDPKKLRPRRRRHLTRE